MPAFIRPKNWNNKPPIGSQINWGHPLAQGLTACFLLNEGGGQQITDLVSGANNPTVTGSFSWSNSFMGPVIGGMDASNYIRFYLTKPLATKEASSLWRGFKTGNPTSTFASFSGLEYATVSTSPFVGITAIGTNGSHVMCQFYNNNGTFQTSASSSNISSYSNNQPLQFMSTIGFSSGQSFDTALWSGNALKEVSGAATTGPALYSSTSHVLIGLRAENIWHSSIYYWDRNMSSGYVSWLYAEPYAFIQPPKSPITYYFFNSGVTHALSALAQSASQIIINTNNSKPLSSLSQSQGAISVRAKASFALSSIFDSGSEVVTLLSHEYNLPSAISESASQIKPVLGKLHALVVISESASQIKALVGKQVSLSVKSQSDSEAQPSLSRVFTGGLADFDIALQMNPPVAALDTGNRPVAFLFSENDNESSINPNTPNSAPDDSNFFV